MTATNLSASRRVAGVRSPTADGATAVRAFLVTYGTTLVPLLAGLLALELGWTQLDGSTWPVAAAALTGWSVAAAAWLHRRHWPCSTVGAVAGAPAVLLAGPIALGWLSPAGLVLWGPMITLLAVAWVMTMTPLAPGPAAYDLQALHQSALAAVDLTADHSTVGWRPARGRAQVAYSSLPRPYTRLPTNPECFPESKVR